MENSKKIVKGISVFFFVLAVLDLVFIGLSATILNGNTASLGSLGVDTEVVKGTFIAVIIGYAVDLLFTVYLAVKGLQVAKGTCKGKAHITLSLIFLVLEVIGIVGCIYLMVTGKGDVAELITCVVSAICLYFYYTNCKKIAG